jgi:hypothetical protein
VGQVNILETQGRVDAAALRLEAELLFSWEISVFFLEPLNWLKFTPIMESHLIYLMSTDLNASDINIKVKGAFTTAFTLVCLIK